MPRDLIKPGRKYEKSMAAQADGSRRRRQALVVAGWIFAAMTTAAFVAALIVLLSRSTNWEDPKYSVAVAAVAGLDPARDLSERGRPALSPVLNVTVHIDNTANTRSSYHGEDCARDLSTATVSYGDALLGRGTVPTFCARPREVAEGVARAWAEDVVVPWFLRDQLAGELAAGEATVDVQLRTPKLFICKAKIGGGLSPCRRPE